MILRDARDSDGQALIALIGGCFAEYEGCILDVDGEMPELREPAAWFARHGGRIWVAEDESGGVGGSVALVPAGSGVELRKLYVRSAWRGRGLGARLVATVEEEARARGAQIVELWTDTRFQAAHRLYERLGYLRSPGSRELHDLSHSVEAHYQKCLKMPRE